MVAAATVVPMLLPVSLLRKPGLLDALNAASSCVIKINNSAAPMQPCQTTLFALLPALPRFVSSSASSASST